MTQAIATSVQQLMQVIQAQTGSPVPPGLMQAVMSGNPPRQARKVTKGSKPMAAKTKTKSPDSNVEAFYYNVDLTITPALSDAKVAGYANQFLKLKQTKTEDVQWDPTKVNAATGALGDFVFVSEATTAVLAVNKPEIYNYEYKVLKDGVKALVTLAASEGATVSGHVVVWSGDTNRPFRLLVSKGTVEVQAGAIGWPDGTSTPFSDPNDGGWI